MKYFAFVDPSGGANDSMVLAIARTSMVTKKGILVGYWEKRAPFNPDSVVTEFSDILRDYGLSTCTGDRYSAQWVVERFASHQIRYLVSERSKSEIFLEFLSLVNSGRVKIPSDKRLRAQFVSLERRTSRSGKDTVDHPASSHDDAANSVAGVLTMAASGLSTRNTSPTCGVHVINCHPLMGEPKRIPEKDWPNFGPPTAAQMDPANDAGFRPSRGPSFGPNWRPR